MIKPAVALVLVAALGAVACDRGTGPSAAADTETANPLATPPDGDQQNLLSTPRGAVVVGRTAEFSLESSAAHAIDGDALTPWSSPAGAVDQTLTFSLGAPTAVESVGVITGSNHPASVRFESSIDGRGWKPIATVIPRATSAPQLADVQPHEALYLRLHTSGAGRFGVLFSAIVRGKETAPARGGDIAGCWTINGEPARFERHGARIRGVIGNDPPIFVDGGTGDRAARLMWTEGPQWGYAMLAVSPDGNSISGTRWHEAVRFQNAGDGWIGSRGDCPATTIDHQRVADLFLEKSGRYHLYGLRFDETDRLIQSESAPALDLLRNRLSNPASQKFRIVAHEFREASGDKNSERAKARLESLRAALKSRGVAVERLEFAVGGADPSRETITLPQKLMTGSVDLERVTR